MGLFSTTPEWRDAVANWRGIQNAPAEENRKRLHGITVFENRFLERFLATSSWFMPGVWYLPIIGYCTYASAEGGLAWSTIAACLLIGALGWTLVEYLLHRFAFHFGPTDIGFVRTILFGMHGYHHEFPSDHRRLVAPPALGWPIAAVLSVFYWAIFGPYWQVLLAGTLLGYLGYDWMHYYTHHAVPKNRFGRFMRRFHMEHHFKSATQQFGLSSPLWDFAFFSYRKPVAPTDMEWECLGEDAAIGNDQLRSDRKAAS